MASRRNNFMDRFPHEDLKNLGITDPISVPYAPNNLTHPLNPVLTRWIGTIEPYHKFIIPVLRLASAMLDSPASVRLVHAIMYERRRYFMTESKEWQTRMYELDGGIPPNETVRFQYYRGLQEINRTSSITLRLFFEHDTALEAKRKYCYTERNRELVCGFDDASPLHQKDGNLSTIWIAHDLIARMQTYEDTNYSLMSEPGLETEPLQLMYSMHRLQFYTATLICHEATRAINYAVSLDSREPYFQNHPHNNLGYVWENEVLGGVLHLTEPKSALSTLCFAKSTEIQHLVETDSKTLPRVSKGIPDVCFSTYYFVPMDYVIAITCQDLWTQIYKDWYNFELLHIPKRVGVRVASSPSSLWKLNGRPCKRAPFKSQSKAGFHSSAAPGLPNFHSTRTLSSSPSQQAVRKPDDATGPNASDGPLSGSSSSGEFEDTVQVRRESEEEVIIPCYLDDFSPLANNNRPRDNNDNLQERKGQSANPEEEEDDDDHWDEEDSSDNDSDS